MKRLLYILFLLFTVSIFSQTPSLQGSPIDSGAGANNPSGTIVPPGQNFHDTKGTIEVNGAGQLQFTLPITLPPGIKTIAPQIELVYTSGSGNGIAGHGWNISGTTAITRSGKNIEKDGELKTVQFDYTDYYSFNGQRLVLKSGEYGKDGAEYMTEKYSNIKIKSVGEFFVKGVPIGPLHFEVTFEDGSQAWYGGIIGAGTRGSTLVTTPLEYNIIKWKDSQGNYISYYYESTSYIHEGSFRDSPGIMRISQISWGGNEKLNKPNFNSIFFSYIERGIKEQTYVKGISFLQNRILSKISVYSNNIQFKRYDIDYKNNGTSYHYVDKITEYNSNNEPANPIAFSYPDYSPPSLEFSAATNNIDSFNNVKLSGDFNGDSYLDFIMNNGIVKLGAFNDNFTTISTNKIFATNAKVVNTLLDEEGQIHNGNGIIQYEQGKIEGYIFTNNNFLKIYEKNIVDYSICTTQPNGVGCTTILNFLNEGDINGDGISDVFISLKRKECEYFQIPDCTDTSPLKNTDGDNIIRPPLCQELICHTYELGNFIVDLKSPNNQISTYTLDSGINENNYTNQKYFDIDGDGKVEIINISNSAYTVFEFTQTAPNQYLKKIKFSNNLIEAKDSSFPVLFGDFNGDGNLDFTIPITNNQVADNWRFYLGTEIGFQTILKTNFLKYRNINSNVGSLVDNYSYSISDLNRDGKSDIIFTYSFNKIGQQNSNGNSNYRTFGYDIYTYICNGFSNDLIDFSVSGNLGGHNYVTFDWQEYGLFAPITAPIKANNNYYDLFLFWKERVHKLKPPTPVGTLSQLRSISQGSVITTINYKELLPGTNFYEKIKKEYYPYFSLARSDKSYAVSQIQENGKKKDFRYRGMTGHLRGNGILGFNQIARSSWYADGFENNKIWSGLEIDPLTEGLPVKEWSIRTNDENKIIPPNISENNTELLYYKSTDYNIEKLVNGQPVTTVAENDKPKVVLAIFPKISFIKDFLTNTITKSTITYGDYYLPSQSISNINDGFSITTLTFEYVHNPSGIASDYYIGRPKTKNTTVQVYGDTKYSKEEYTYESNLLKTSKVWNRNNTGYFLDSFNYDGFGNIIKKTHSNSIDVQTQTTIAEYDPKGIFLIKKTDNLGLETSITYNNWGQVLTQADPLGNTLTNEYDTWGKVLKSKTNLEGTTTYVYEKDNNSNIIITQYDPDGNISKIYTNKIGQEYKSSTKSFNQGQYVSKNIIYDTLGRKIKESEPYFEGQNASQWNITVFDDNFFPPKVTTTSFNGKQIQSLVSGLITTVKELNGYNRITTKTTDALGNVVSSTDKGGTINFSYNAAGEQIYAKYEQNIVSTQYDEWGRKSEFNDPSNGKYTFKYDGFGQIKQIKSPNGTKEYTYNSLGQLITQKEISNDGTSTDKHIIYTYDDKGRVILKNGTSKGKSFSSSVQYDQQGRVLSSSEDSNGKQYGQKEIKYDDKARIITYDKILYSSGVLTKTTIENIYSEWNGELTQVKDKTSGKVLWALNETNAKGQALVAQLGRTKQLNTYDSNGFLTSIDLQQLMQLQGTPSLLLINYSFDAINNELTSRNTLGQYNILETFNYDDNNRLVSWTDPRTGQMSSNAYDEKGRITKNDQVGDIKFENSTKIYQPTNMILNSAGEQNYLNDLIQLISYNENNDPIYINGLKGDVAFEYGLTSMRQKVTYGGNFEQGKDGKFTKYYSEDGSFEVIRDNITGKEKHILYIGGNPYDSNIVYMKNYEESNASYKFLHKDYLGSILAITDEAGNKLEQRHFDAWGNMTHLQVGSGTIITNKNDIQANIEKYGLIVDRAYTSHEHFFEVGIIHMNGRLYDPLLRRFLNADENIQDPHNTQIYNKYGYALNNPLLYNDPSGEVLPFLIGVGLGCFWATVISGAIIGAAISIGLYALQATYANNWSWGGFGKALLLGSVTGAVSSGLGQIFSGAGFWATAGNGAISGLGTGAVTSIINGTNFLEGITKGAIIGGVVASAGWIVSKTIQYYNSKKPTFITSNELQDAGYDVSDKNFEDYYKSDVQIHNDFSKTTGDYQASVDNINTKYTLATSDNVKYYDKQMTHDFRIISNDSREPGYILGFNVTRRKNLMEFLIKGEASITYISPSLGLKSDIVKKAVFGHEYIHGYHRYIGLSTMPNFRNNTESSAYHFSINVLKKNGLDFSSFVNSFRDFGGKFSGSYNWVYAVKNIVNFKK